MEKSRQKRLSKSKSQKKFNKKGKKQQNQQPKEDPNKLLEKGKLLAFNSDKQLETMKEIYDKIVLQPQDNIKHLETLFTLVKVPNLKVAATALRILADAFINIAPLDAIDLKKLEERTEVKIKKQEYKVVRFQKELVAQYERYIKMIKEMHIKTKLENFNNDKEIYREFKKCLLQCVIKCYRTLWNFNWAKQLNQLAMKFIKYEECQSFFKEILESKNIAMIGIKAKIISGIAKYIAKELNEKAVPKNLIKILNSTLIDTRYLKKDEQTFEYKKKQLKKRLYKQEAFDAKKQKEKKAEKGTLEMKRKKKEEKLREKIRVKEEVQKEFAEGEAIIKNKEFVRANSNILQELFYIYFKILVERVNSIFLRDVLDGILKFVHLINIQLTKSLLQHLTTSAVIYRDLWRTKKSSELIQTRLLIVFTGESILNGPLSVYNMDDLHMITHLYKIMKDINSSNDIKKNKYGNFTQEAYRLLCINLEQAFVKRRQLSHEVVGSFIRQICLFLNYYPVPKLYMLELIRIFAYKYHKVTRMFQEDNEGFGLNSFNPFCEDPQCSNAMYTEIISQLRSIKSDHSEGYQHAIQTIVERLCKQNFQQRDIKRNLQDILNEEMDGGFF